MQRYQYDHYVPLGVPIANAIRAKDYKDFEFDFVFRFIHIDVFIIPKKNGILQESLRTLIGTLYSNPNTEEITFFVKENLSTVPGRFAVQKEVFEQLRDKDIIEFSLSVDKKIENFKIRKEKAEKVCKQKGEINKNYVRSGINCGYLYYIPLEDFFKSVQKNKKGKK